LQNFGGGKIGCLGVGVFEPKPNVGPFQVFFWEFGMTFVLVSTIIACCVNVPNWGNVSPLIIGISIFATVVAGGNFTGGAVNPARFFSASIVYGCSLDKIHLCVKLLRCVVRQAHFVIFPTEFPLCLQRILQVLVRRVPRRHVCRLDPAQRPQ
jgi:hypothetical protein